MHTVIMQIPGFWAVPQWVVLSGRTGLGDEGRRSMLNGSP